MNNDNQLQDPRQYWDDIAPVFDHEPDHGLHDPEVLENWTRLLKSWLPPTEVSILDIGCGTGSLSVVLAGLGHKVTGIDFSPPMITLAQAKAVANNLQIEFHVMDAAFPQFQHRKFDVIVCRHLLWALPEPERVLQRWVELLPQKGRLIMVEGFWGTGAGLHAKEIIEYLPPAFTKVTFQNLSENPKLWGRLVTDERYAIIADCDSRIHS